jgi:predicted AlkP superfamily phosphohydrolase/phosphomutase
VKLGTLAILAAALLACGSGERGGDRVLLVGIDGATLRVAGPMVRAGALPNLARIGGAGVYGHLRSHFPLMSPRIWTSIATGKVPEKHGILGFAHPGEGGGEAQLYLGSDRLVHALWNIASDAGLSVGVVNWWNTYPPETVNGVIVSDHLLPAEVRGRRWLTGAAAPRRAPIIYPPEWAERVATVLEDERPLTRIADPFADGTRLPAWTKPGRLSEHYRTDEAIARIALDIEAELQPDVLMVLLPGIDRISHVLWGGIEAPEEGGKAPPMSVEERAASAAALRRYYAFTDALIGRLMERYGSDDLVMVVSDHGFEAGSTLNDTSGIHTSRKALRGLLFARGRGIGPPDAPGPVSVNDVTPTVLAWLGLPVAADMDGKVAGFLRGGAAAAVIDTYDTAPVERASAPPSGAESAIFEELRALGYLESGGGP